MSINVSESYSASIPSQLSDGILVPSYKWFTLQDNVLDGTYHPVVTDGSVEVGWWSNTLSDSTGVLSTNPTITYTFTACNVKRIFIYGDSLLNVYPVNFDYTLKDGSGNILASQSVTGNTNVNWYTDLTQVATNATALTYTIHSINKPNTAAKIVETGIGFNVSTTDSILVKITETTNQQIVQLSDVDMLTPKLIDSTNIITNQLSDTESVLVKITDSTKSITNKLYSTDTVKPKLTDTPKLITNKLHSTDTVKPKLTDSTKGITNKLYSTDTSKVKITDQQRQVTNKLYDDDTVKPALLDATEPLYDIHSVMQESVRQIFSKVEIVYTDPMMDGGATVTPSSTNRIGDAYQLVDGCSRTDYKWFSLFNNTLDGSFHCADDTSNVGWWGGVLSDASGTFATPESVAIEFTARPLNRLSIYGDDTLAIYPYDFDVNLYQGTTLAFTQQVRGNQGNYVQGITPVLGVTKLEVVVYKMTQQAPCILTEVMSIIVEEYTGDQVVDIHLLEELDYEDTGVPLGAVSANEIDITLLNADRTFDISNTDSILYGLLRKNRRVIPWLGAKVNGDIEWHQLGKFWTTSWKAPFADINASLVARDTLELMRTDDFTTSQLYQNYTLYQLFDLLCTSFGLHADEYNIDDSLSSITIPYAWFDRMSYMDALISLAKSAFVKVYCDREGILQIQAKETTGNYMTNFHMNELINDYDYPNASISTTNSVEVLVNSLIPISATSIYSTNASITIPADTTQDVTCLYTSIPCINIQAPVIDMDANLTLTTTQSFVWGVILSIQNTTANDLLVNSINITGTPLKVVGVNSVISEDITSIGVEGRRRQQVDAPFIQDAGYAQQLADKLLRIYANQQADITLETRGDIAIGIGHDITVSTVYDEERPYTVFRQDLEYDGGLSVTMDCKNI